jgi:c-di-GMP-binding flagellar brake protein YcgR
MAEATIPREKPVASGASAGDEEQTEHAGTADPRDRSFTQILKRKVEISRALLTLRNQSAGITLRFAGDPTRYSARILDVQHGELLLEDLTPRSGLRLMSAGRSFALYARAEGMYLHAQEIRNRLVDEERGVPFFRIPLPAMALFQQRRQATRYRLSLGGRAERVPVTIHRDVMADRDHPAVIDGRAVDISAGGCRLQLPGPLHPPLAADEVLTACIIRLPGAAPISACGTVRYADYNKASRIVACGLEFGAMALQDRRRLDRFLRMLARARQSRSVS